MTPEPETIIAARLMHLDQNKRAFEQARELISELELYGYRIVKIVLVPEKKERTP
jgi:hypothetical protein